MSALREGKKKTAKAEQTYFFVYRYIMLAIRGDYEKMVLGKYVALFGRNRLNPSVLRRGE